MRREHGQAAALTVLFMTVLLLSAAAVIDVGSWFREDRDTQRIADAAALAGAQALPEDAGTAQSLAIEYGTKNGGGVSASNVSFSTTVMPGDTISVDVERPAPGFFSKVIGIDSVDVGSDAKARAGVPSEARWAAPFAVREDHPFLQCQPEPCFGEDTRLELEKVGPGNFKMVNIDGSKGPQSPPVVADWILRGFDGFMDIGWYYSTQGTRFDSIQIRTAMSKRVGTELLFPVYRSVSGVGDNLQYDIVGWVGVFVTDYQFRGEQQSWIDGYFTRVIWEGLLSTTSSGSPDFGVRSVALID